MPDVTTREYLKRALVEVIGDIQRDAGRDVPTITDDTVPLDQIIGFDSVCGVEAAVLISERVAFEIESIPFVSPKAGHHMTVREIVDSLVASHGHCVGAGIEPSSMAHASASKER